MTERATIQQMSPEQLYEAYINGSDEVRKAIWEVVTQDHRNFLAWQRGQNIGNQAQ